MWKLTKRFTFEAAHRLPNHDGKCRRLHGHSWAAVVEVRGVVLHETGPKQGMLVDYSDIKGVVNPLVEQYLDHHYLNETLEMENPTSEHIAQWLYDRLRVRMTGLYSVTIEETCTCACTFTRDGDPISTEGAKELAKLVEDKARARAKGQVGQ